MKCSKCGYTTFDIYEFCPKCRNDFTFGREILHLLKYKLTESNNYLVESDSPFGNNIISESPLLSTDKSNKDETLEDLTSTTLTDKKDVFTSESSESDDNSEEEFITLEEVDPDEITATLENFEKEEIDTKPEKDNSNMQIENFEKTEDDISLEDIGLEELLETNREE